jgi:hypothetical protein
MVVRVSVAAAPTLKKLNSTNSNSKAAGDSAGEPPFFPKSSGV